MKTAMKWVINILISPLVLFEILVDQWSRWHWNYTPFLPSTETIERHSVDQESLKILDRAYWQATGEGKVMLYRMIRRTR